MSVADEFAQFRNDYLIDPETLESIRLRYRRITRRLNLDFWNSDSETARSLYVGSYGRDTAASGISDLDIAFVLPYEIYRQYNARASNGQSALLQAVKTSIKRTYPLTPTVGDGQVVVTSFADGIEFDVLPVFDNTDGSWTHPNANYGGWWDWCNPRAEIAAINSLGKAVRKNFKSLCRMTRVWKAYWGVPMKGALIDTLAFNFIRSWDYRENSFVYHDWMARDFFYYLATRSREQTYWLVPGSNKWVYPSGNFQGKAKIAYDVASQAVDHDLAGQHWSRRQKWRLIFGTLYPAN